MLNEIAGVVIDTNVLVHACNEAIMDYNESSISLLQNILETEAQLFVDDIFDVVEANNTSRINHEYINHVRHGTYSYYFLMSMAMSGRIQQIEECTYNKNKKLFNKMVRNKADIIFLSVTMCTPNKLLVSNDYEDFTLDKRKHWRRELSLNVLDSCDVTSAEHE